MTGPAGSAVRPEGSPSEPPEDHAGDIAIVLHSHMPYVEGYGTYPFGEEWLFDAVIRSYVPVLDVAERLTMTITPVLADQLEAPGVAERLLAFARDYRLSSTRRDATDFDGPLRVACEDEAERYAVAVAALERRGGDVLAAFADAARSGRVELVASAATHAILPLLATGPGRRLQIEAGLASHRRRFGRPRGFWLPECAYEPGLEQLLEAAGIDYFCVDQSAREPEPAALRPIRAGPLTAFPIDWAAVQWLWSLDGYPADPLHADFHRKSLRGARPWSIGGEAYEPERARERARAQGREFAAAAADRLCAHRDATGRSGLLVFAIDTELLGHWWWEGPEWLHAALAELPRRGIRPLTLAEARAIHEPEPRPLGRASWGEGKDLRTWEGPAVADLCRGARRLELRTLAAVCSRRLAAGAAERAARELLAVQASDWAFLDSRRQAGDYPYRRVLDHAEALFEAIDSAEPVQPELRNLAPDLSVAALLEP